MISGTGEVVIFLCERESLCRSIPGRIFLKQLRREAVVQKGIGFSGCSFDVGEHRHEVHSASQDTCSQGVAGRVTNLLLPPKTYVPASLRKRVRNSTRYAQQGISADHVEGRRRGQAQYPDKTAAWATRLQRPTLQSIIRYLTRLGAVIHYSRVLYVAMARRLRTEYVQISAPPDATVVRRPGFLHPFPREAREASGGRSPPRRSYGQHLRSRGNTNRP
jgi:hypothetical protein